MRSLYQSHVKDPRIFEAWVYPGSLLLYGMRVKCVFDTELVLNAELQQPVAVGISVS